jgi:hypothetical protein
MDPVAFVFCAMISGLTVVANSMYEVVLWPVSKTLCPADQKMTTHSGCQPHTVMTADDTALWLCVLCCLLATCASGVTLGFPVASLFSGTCCALSFLCGAREVRKF